MGSGWRRRRCRGGVGDRLTECERRPFTVIPAKAGIQTRHHAKPMDSRLRGKDGYWDLICFARLR